jgi:hypothetical protein
MSIVTRPPYRRGQKQFTHGQLNDADMQARQLRKGLPFNVIGARVTQSSDSMGNRFTMEVAPVIYKLVSTSTPANSSSSSESSTDGRHANIRQVNLDTQQASGPIIRVRMGNIT